MTGQRETNVQTVEVLRRAGPSGREGYWAHGIWLVAGQKSTLVFVVDFTVATCETKFKARWIMLRGAHIWNVYSNRTKEL